MNINPHAVTQLFQNTASQVLQDDVAHINIPEIMPPRIVDPSPNKNPKKRQRKKNKKNPPDDKENNRCINDFDHVVLDIIDETNAKAKVKVKITSA